MNEPIDLHEPWHPKPPALTPRVTTEDFSKGPIKPPAPLGMALRPMNENGERLRLIRKSPTTRTDAFIRGFVPAAIGCIIGYILGMWVAVSILN